MMRGFRSFLEWLEASLALNTIRSRIFLGGIATVVILLAFSLVLVWRLNNIVHKATILSQQHHSMNYYALQCWQGMQNMINQLHSLVYPSGINLAKDENRQLQESWQEDVLTPYQKLIELSLRQRSPEVEATIEAIQNQMERLQRLIPEAISLNTEANRQYLYNSQSISLLQQGSSEGVLLPSIRANAIFNEKLAFLLSNIVTVQDNIGLAFEKLIRINNRSITRLDQQLNTESSRLSWIEVAAILLTFLLIFWTTAYLVRLIGRDMLRIQTQAQLLSIGEIPPATYTRSQELNPTASYLNELAKRFKLLSEYAVHVAKGDYSRKDSIFPAHTTLGKSLQEMQMGLQQVSRQESLRTWRNEGLALFSNILRSTQDLDILGNTLIKNIVQRLGANQGGLFITTGKQIDREDTLRLIGCYAYDKQKYLQKEISIGEGLLGRVWKEGKSIYIHNIPNKYLEIRSGLGGAMPRYLFIAPLKVADKVEGVVEIASFHEISQAYRDFVEELAESIATTFANIKAAQRTQQLLNELQEANDLMRERDEEMRQNLEELQATQEEMERAQREIATKEGNLKALLNNTSDAILAIDLKYQITFINNVMKRLYESFGVYLDEGRQLEEPLPGLSWKETQRELKRAFGGERVLLFTELTARGEHYYYEVHINPIYNERQRVYAASIFITDITQQRKAEIELRTKEANLNSLINNTEDSIVAIDRSFRILVFNEEFKRRRKDIDLHEGDDYLRLLPEDRRDEWRLWLERALRGERFQKIIKREADRRAIYREYSFNPIFNQEGEVIGVSIFSKDITEAKMAEAENQRIIQQLFEQRTQLKSRIEELEKRLQELQATS